MTGKRSGTRYTPIENDQPDPRNDAGISSSSTTNEKLNKNKDGNAKPAYQRIEILLTKEDITKMSQILIAEVERINALNRKKDDLSDVQQCM